MRTAFVTATMCLLALPANAKYSGGTGEPNDPYQIATAADLIALGETPADYDKHFILTADIDLDPNLPGRKVFDEAVIAPDTDPCDWVLSLPGGPRFTGTNFSGVFDGNGHTISHLTITGESFLGLFGSVGAEVKDLGVTDVCIASSGWYVGGLAGYNCYRDVTQCYSTGVVDGNDYVGGLVGCNEGGTITQCYSTGAVSGDGGAVGGLVGTNEWGTVAHCYSTSIVTGVGGLVGSNDAGSVIQCYSTGTVTGTHDAGGLVGRNYDGTVTACFWDIQTSGQGTSEGGMGKTTDEMQNPNTFMAEGWDFVNEADGPSDIWAEPMGRGCPILWWQLSPLPSLPTFSGGTGQWDDPYLISTAQELSSIGYSPRLMDSHFKLIADVNLAGVHFHAIGNEASLYAGVFDGNGYTISNFVYDSNGVDNIGLFGYVCGGAIKNLGLIDPKIDGGTGNCVGPLVGYLLQGSITNCCCRGGMVSGSWDVGGLVGLNDGGTVSQCYSSGSVSGTSEVGGLVGCNRALSAYCSVTNCYSTGTVRGNSSVGGLVGSNSGRIAECDTSGVVSGSEYVGGLVGVNSGYVTQCYSASAVSGGSLVGGLVGWNEYGTVTQCCSTGVVSATGHYVGGLVGLNSSVLTACYSTGTFNGNSAVGGLVGHNNGSVDNCYSSGSVSGTSDVGGLIGSYYQGSTRSSFWDTETSGQTISAGGTGKTTAEMQTAKTFLDAGWDFVGETANGTEDIWWIDEGKDYPHFSWEKYSGGRGEPNDPYQIATAADLIALGETPADYDKHFILIADIDLDPNLPGRKVFDRAVIAPDVNDLQYNFQGTAFTGTFDGGGHAIRNLTIADPNHDCLGLFGMIAAGGRVGDLALVNAEISGGYRSINVGTLAGYNAGTLAECSAMGIAIGCGNVRELAGYNTGSITNCRADVQVSWLCE